MHVYVMSSRNNLKYNNVEILENAYGISLRQLMLFGMKTYGIEDGIEAARAAITVMLLSLRGSLYFAHPEYEMGNRLMLDRLDRAAGCRSGQKALSNR